MEQQFETKQVEAQHILTIRATTTIDKLPELLGELFGEVYTHILQLGQQPVGMPFSMYHAMDGVNVDFESGMPSPRRSRAPAAFRRASSPPAP